MCADCKGRGWKEATSKTPIELRINPKARPGHTIRVPGMGGCHAREPSRPADLVVVLRAKAEARPCLPGEWQGRQVQVFWDIEVS